VESKADCIIAGVLELTPGHATAAGIRRGTPTVRGVSQNIASSAARATTIAKLLRDAQHYPQNHDTKRSGETERDGELIVHFLDAFH
jgi:hypothetical protein